MRAGLLVVIFLMAAAANALPTPYLTEKVSATYLPNGILYAPASKIMIQSSKNTFGGKQYAKKEGGKDQQNINPLRTKRQT